MPEAIIALGESKRIVSEVGIEEQRQPDRAHSLT